MRWEMVPDAAACLEDILSEEGRVIKRSPAKDVRVCEHGGRTYYVKRYLHGVHPLRPLKYRFKPSPARQEWELASELERRGIPVVRHLALGERWQGLGLQESVLVTEGFDGQPVRCDMADEASAVLSFVERMHDAGVLQKDLHGANLLCHPDTGEMRMVDLYGSELHDSLTPEARRHNLAVLRITLPIPVSEEVMALSRALRREVMHHRSKRVWKYNREFEPLVAGRVRWQVRLPQEQAAVTGILKDPDGFLSSRARLLKSGHSSTVGAADGVVLKRYNLKKPINMVKDLFRPCRAMRAFRLGHHLELVGIPTARPLAAGVRRRAGLTVASYFLMEELIGALPLAEAKQDQSFLVAAVARLVGHLHDEGFSHRDLKISNLMVGPKGQLYLIDLEGLAFVGRVRMRRAHADLARLQRSALTIPHLERGWLRQFLRAYCQVRHIRGRAATQFLRWATS